jgi:hypothetical protein
LQGVVLLVLLGWTAAPPPAAAWGRNGHRIVCEIAFQRFTPESRELVRELQRGEAQRFHETCLWADRVKRTTHQETYDYHFVNIPAGKSGLDLQRDCPNGGCLPWAIDHYRAILADTSNSRHQRNEALKFLGHLVGDVHQPLHAGRPEDRGGNEIEVCFFGDCGHPQDRLDLHRVWDSNILNHGRERWQQIARRLNDATTDEEAQLWLAGAPRSWIDESYRLDEDFVYPKVPADGIGEEYYEEAYRIVEKRLQQGGVRLAEMINRIAAQTAVVAEH